MLRRVTGRSFHARGPATANDLSPKVLLQRCMTCVYEDEVDDRPFVARVIHRLANYDGGVLPNIAIDQADDEPVAPSTSRTGCLRKNRPPRKIVKKTAQKAVSRRYCFSAKHANQKDSTIKNE